MRIRRNARCAQFLQHVLRRFHQFGALADECVAPPRLRRVDGARDRENLAALLGSHPGGDQRAGSERRLHDQRALGEARDDAVALGKVGRQGRRAEGVFADEQAARGNAVREVEVLARIDAIQPRADHGDGGWVRICQRCRTVERALVRCGIHAQCEARNDGEAGLSQGARKQSGMFGSLRRRVAASHDGQASSRGKRCLLHQPRRSHQVQQQRGVFRVQQQLRIAWIPQRDHRAGGAL